MVGRQAESASPLGDLYPFLRELQQESRFELSFLNDEFRDLGAWKPQARARLWEIIPEKVAPCALEAEVVERVDGGDCTRKKAYFNSTPVTRVRTAVLIGIAWWRGTGGMMWA